MTIALIGPATNTVSAAGTHLTSYTNFFITEGENFNNDYDYNYKYNYNNYYYERFL